MISKLHNIEGAKRIFSLEQAISELQNKGAGKWQVFGAEWDTYSGRNRHGIKLPPQPINFHIVENNGWWANEDVATDRMRRFFGDANLSKVMYFIPKTVPVEYKFRNWEVQDYANNSHLLYHFPNGSAKSKEYLQINKVNMVWKEDEENGDDKGAWVTESVQIGDLVITNEWCKENYFEYYNGSQCRYAELEAAKS